MILTDPTLTTLANVRVKDVSPICTQYFLQQKIFTRAFWQHEQLYSATVWELFHRRGGIAC
jgi:hypothetical protein